MSEWIPRVGKFSPVHDEQQNQSRQVGRGNVGFLLEAEEDDDDDEARNDVVALAEGEKHDLLIGHVAVVGK